MPGTWVSSGEGSSYYTEESTGEGGRTVASTGGGGTVTGEGGTTAGDGGGGLSSLVPEPPPPPPPPPPPRTNPWGSSKQTTNIDRTSKYATPDYAGAAQAINQVARSSGPAMPMEPGDYELPDLAFGTRLY